MLATSPRKRGEVKARRRFDHISLRTRMCRRAHSRRFLAEGGGWLSGQGREHQRNHMAEAFIPGLLRQKVAAENHAERCAVGEIEKAQRRDRNVELHRIDRDLEV